MSTTISTNISIKPEEYTRIRDLIYKKSGMFFPESKKDFVSSKLKKRLEAHNLSSFMDYSRLLESASGNYNEWTALFNEITINETFFFRDLNLLDAFEKQVLIPLIDERIKQNNKKIRIWSCACSTGEEPYTLAILVLANLKLFAGSFDIQILASDISTRVLETAKEGVYDQRSIQYVPEKYLKRYFIPQDGKYKIKDNVKQFVRFSNINLTDKTQVGLVVPQDTIFCRNVLIYFDDNVRRDVIKKLYSKINPNSYLFLGHSESLHKISEDFKLIFFHKAKAYKKE